MRWLLVAAVLVLTAALVGTAIEYGVRSFQFRTDLVLAVLIVAVLAGCTALS